jgi:hypothetical protein
MFIVPLNPAFDEKDCRNYQIGSLHLRCTAHCIHHSDLFGRLMRGVYAV